MVGKKPYDEPTKVTAENGEVVLDGPDGIGLSMTPEAAAESGKRLAQGAKDAKAALTTERRRH